MVWLLLALMFDLPPSDVDVVERPWVVRGRTADDLAAALLAAPTPGVVGRTRVRGRVSCQPGPRDAGVLDVSVQVRVEVQLPTWDAPAEAAPDLARRFRTFADEVRAHELGHAAIARSHVAVVDRQLRALPTCAHVWSAADEVFDAMIAAHDDWDHAHGAIAF